MVRDTCDSAGRVIAYQEDNSADYRPEKVSLPVKESSFVQIGRGKHEVDVQAATVDDVGLLRLGVRVESVGVNVFNDGYIGFAVPLSWVGDFFINGLRVKNAAIYTSADLDSLHLRSKQRDTVGVTFPRVPFERAIAALAGIDPDDVSLNQRELLLDERVYWALKSRLTSIIDRTLNPRARDIQRQIHDEVMELMIDAYLQSHIESDLPRGRQCRPDRVVRLAENCFMAAGQSPVSLADLCLAAGVGKTNLYKAFHRVCGQSPLSYFHRRRLMHSRSELLVSENRRGSVKRVALDCGFTEFGRFSAEYKRLFGELPSTTLSRK